MMLPPYYVPMVARDASRDRCFSTVNLRLERILGIWVVLANGELESPGHHVRDTTSQAALGEHRTRWERPSDEAPHGPASRPIPDGLTPHG